MMMTLALSPSRENLRHLQLETFHWDFNNQLNESALKLDRVVDMCRSMTFMENRHQR